jgi:hypothetical protein
MTEPDLCVARILKPHELPFREKYQRLLKAVIEHAAGGSLNDLLYQVKELEGT